MHESGKPNNGQTEITLEILDSRFWKSAPAEIWDGYRELSSLPIFNGDVISTAFENLWAPYPYQRIISHYNNWNNRTSWRDETGTIILPEDMAEIQKLYATRLKLIRSGLLERPVSEITDENLRVSERNRRRLEDCGIWPYKYAKCGLLDKQAHHGIVDYTLRTGPSFLSKARVPGAPSYLDGLTICIDPHEHGKIHQKFESMMKLKIDANNTVSFGDVMEVAFKSLDEEARSVSKICKTLFKAALKVQYSGIHPADGIGFFNSTYDTRLRGLRNHSEDNPNIPMMNTLSKEWGFKFPW